MLQDPEKRTARRKEESAERRCKLFGRKLRKKELHDIKLLVFSHIYCDGTGVIRCNVKNSVQRFSFLVAMCTRSKKQRKFQCWRLQTEGQFNRYLLNLSDAKTRETAALREPRGRRMIKQKRKKS